MRTIGSQIKQSGGRLVLIGNGTVDDAKRYASEEDLPFELLVDPQLVGYGALELRRSVLATYSPRGIPRLVQALREGFRPARAYGVTDQMGGVFVISPTGDVNFGSREPKSRR